MSDLPIAASGQRTGYRVKLPVYEGPLDLLLQLIEREELDITRVSLARVTDQYLEYLKALEELPVGDLTDFVVVASRLLLIKSRALLPRPATSVHLEDEDAGDELVRQLRAYKQFKEAAKYLEELQTQGHRSYVRLVPHPQISGGIAHLETVPLEALVAAARRAIHALSSSPPPDHPVSPPAVTIADQIHLITEALTKQPHVSFTSLLAAAYSRREVIVTLLAVLELIKRQQVQAQQERMFGEIVIVLLKE